MAYHTPFKEGPRKLNFECAIFCGIANSFVLLTKNIPTAFDLQSWPELLGHKGNKPVKMTYFLPPPPPDAMLMSGIQVIFGRLNIAWVKGGTKEMVY